MCNSYFDLIDDLYKQLDDKKEEVRKLLIEKDKLTEKFINDISIPLELDKNSLRTILSSSKNFVFYEEESLHR